MSGDKMEVELAEQKLKTMEHSEQHYFKRYVFFYQLRVAPTKKETVAWRFWRATIMALKRATLTYYACVQLRSSWYEYTRERK